MYGVSDTVFIPVEQKVPQFSRKNIQDVYYIQERDFKTTYFQNNGLTLPAPHYHPLCPSKKNSAYQWLDRWEVVVWRSIHTPLLLPSLGDGTTSSLGETKETRITCNVTRRQLLSLRSTLVRGWSERAFSLRVLQASSQEPFDISGAARPKSNKKPNNSEARLARSAS